MKEENFKLLIFDLDGTIVDSQKDIASAVNFVRSIYNKPALDLETICSYIGNGVKTLIEQIFPDLSKNEHKKALVSILDYYGKHLTDTTVIYPGMKQIIEQSKNHTKAVLSNKPEKLSINLLRSLNISQYFKIIWGADTLDKKKPDPEPVLKIIQKLKFSKQKTLMIGDGINDVLAAKSAGIKCAAVGYGYTDNKTLIALAPDYFINKPEELLNII